MIIRLNTSLRDLYSEGFISTRIYNCFRSQKFTCFSDILVYEKAPEDLLRIKKLGRKSLSEINSLIQRYRSDIASRQVDSDDFDKFLTNAYEILNASINDGSCDRILIEYILSHYKNARSINQLIVTNPGLLLIIDSQMSIEQYLQLKTVLLNFIIDVITQIESLGDGEYHYCVEYSKYQFARTILLESGTSVSPELYIKYFFSEKKINYLRKWYSSFDEKLSVRAKNLKRRKLSNIEDAIFFFDKPIKEYSKLTEHGLIGKTVREIFSMVQKLKEEYSKIINCDERTVDDFLIKQQLPFFLSCERKRIIDFQTKYGRLPRFYILYSFLKIIYDSNSKKIDNKFLRIIILRYGLFDGENWQISKLASNFDLSFERIRQLLSESAVKKKFRVYVPQYIRNFDDYVDLINLPFLTINSIAVMKIASTELEQYAPTTILKLLYFASDFSLYEIGDIIILLKSEYFNVVDVKKIYQELCALKSAKYSKDTLIDCSFFVSGVPDADQKWALQLALYIAVDICGLEIVGDCIVMKQNYVDVADEICKMLESSDNPMPIEDIFSTFKSLYPQHKIESVNQIRHYLLRDTRIKPIGKTSTYALSSRKDLFFGGIREMVETILMESDEPVHIENIYEKVLESYPSTNVKSLMSNIGSDPSRKFIAFDDGYYGLSSKVYPSFSSIQIRNVRRHSFEERMMDFRSFLETYHRFPYFSGSDEESSLARWYYNIVYGILILPEDKKNLFDELVNEYIEKGYPRIGKEAEFLKKCNDYKSFLLSHHKCPTYSSSPELFYWYKRSKENYDSYIDMRRKYLTDLFAFIKSYGFCI